MKEFGNLASLITGIALGWTSPEIPKFKETGTPLDVLPTSEEESWIGSLISIGAVVGALFTGLLPDKIGRKNTLLLGGIPFAVAFILACVATTIFYIYVLRFLCGLGGGIIFSVLPMYIGEIADDEVRGQLGSFMELFLNFGLAFSYAAGPYLNITYFNLLCLGFSILYLILFFIFVPESPYYFVQVNRMKDAEASLMKLRSASAKKVKIELNMITTSVEASKAKKARIVDIFATRASTKAFIISLSLITFQQLSGIDVILFYAQDIFQGAKTSLSPEVSAILIGVVQILSSIVTTMFIEKSGKRLLLLISATGMSLSLAVLGYYYYLVEKKEDVSGISWIPVMCLSIFIMVFCVGFGPIPLAIMGELFPENIKSVAIACITSFCWFLAFLVTKYFHLISEHIGRSGSFGLFSSFCLAAGIFTWFYVPETTGKSLQEIQKLLGN